MVLATLPPLGQARGWTHLGCANGTLWGLPSQAWARGHTLAGRHHPQCPNREALARLGGPSGGGVHRVDCPLIVCLSGLRL